MVMASLDHMGYDLIPHPSLVISLAVKVQLPGPLFSGSSHPLWKDWNMYLLLQVSWVPQLFSKSCWNKCSIVDLMMEVPSGCALSLQLLSWIEGCLVQHFLFIAYSMDSQINVIFQFSFDLPIHLGGKNTLTNPKY